MKSNIIKEFNLPPYIKNKSFAEASQAIQKKFEERNDPAAKRTMEELLDRLKNAQEYVKQMNQPASQEASQAPQQAQGQPMPQMNPELMQQLEQAQGGQNQMAGGGPLLLSKGVMGSTAKGIPEMLGKAHTKPGMVASPISGASSGGPGAGGISSMAGTALEFGNQMFSNPENSMDMTGNTKYEMPSKGMSAASGAVKGASAASALGPIGAGVGAVVGGIAGFASAGKEQKAIRKGISNKDLREYNNQMNPHAKGGYTNEYSGEEDFSSYIDYNLIKKDFNSPKFNPNMDASMSGASEFNFKGKPSAERSPLNLNKSLEWLDKNKASIGRLAPVGANIYQLANMKDPEVEKLNTLTGRYKPQYMDRKEMMNTIDQSFNPNASTEGSGGSLSRYSTLEKSQNLSKALSKSQAQGQINQAERNENKTEQQFNLNLDRFNINQSNNEKQMNAQNRAAYDSNKSRFITALGDNLGNMSTEAIRQQRAEALTGYDWMGDYGNPSDIIVKAKDAGYTYDQATGTFEDEEGNIYTGAEAKKLVEALSKK